MGSRHLIFSLGFLIFLTLTACSGRETIQAGHSSGNSPYPQYTPGSPQPDPVAPIIGAEEEGEGVINEEILEGDDDADSEGPEIINTNEVNNSVAVAEDDGAPQVDEPEGVDQPVPPDAVPPPGEQDPNEDNVQPIGHLVAGGAAFNNPNFVNAAQQGGMAGFTMAVGGAAGAGGGGGAAGAGAGQGAADCSGPFVIGAEAEAMEGDQFTRYHTSADGVFYAIGEAPLSVALYPTLNGVRISREETRYQYHWFWNNSSWSRNRAPGFVANNPGIIHLYPGVIDTVCNRRNAQDQPWARLDVTTPPGDAEPPAPQPTEPPAEPPVSVQFDPPSPPSASVTPVIPVEDVTRLQFGGPAEEFAVAMDGDVAVVVKIRDDNHISYRAYMTHFNTFEDWHRLKFFFDAIPSCPRGQKRVLKYPSVAMTKNGGRIMIAVELQCREGVTVKSRNVARQTLLRQSGRYVEQEDSWSGIAMGQTGEKWSPKAVCLRGGDCAVAWLRKEVRNMPEPECEGSCAIPGYSTKLVREKVYVKIFPHDGNARGPLRVNDYAAPIPDEYKSNIVARDLEHSLSMVACENNFFFNFSDHLKNNFGKSDLYTNEIFASVDRAGRRSVIDWSQIGTHDVPAREIFAVVGDHDACEIVKLERGVGDDLTVFGVTVVSADNPSRTVQEITTAVVSNEFSEREAAFYSNQGTRRIIYPYDDKIAIHELADSDHHIRDYQVNRWYLNTVKHAISPTGQFISVWMKPGDQLEAIFGDLP